MTKPGVTTLLIGRILFVGFLVLPTFPNAITGWDSVSSWSPGGMLFVWEPFTIATGLGDAVSFTREVAANPDEYRGDGLAYYQRDVAYATVQHASILVTSVLMGVCAIRKWKRRRWCMTGAVFMLCGLSAFVWNYMIKSQTYVGGRYHIGAGSYVWVAACLTLITSLLINTEKGENSNPT